jgi:hypothetical protein
MRPSKYSPEFRERAIRLARESGPTSKPSYDDRRASQPCSCLLGSRGVTI